MSALMQGVEICCVTGWDYLSFTAQQKKTGLHLFFSFRINGAAYRLELGECFVLFHELFGSSLICILPA